MGFNVEIKWSTVVMKLTTFFSRLAINCVFRLIISSRVVETGKEIVRSSCRRVRRWRQTVAYTWVN
jgi:hypothetical protein